MTLAHASEVLFKIRILGNNGSGKSSLIRRFTHNSFADSYSPTQGDDTSTSAQITIDTTVVRSQIFDTGHHDGFKANLSPFRGMDGFLVVYDIGNQASFDNVPEWLKEIDRYCTGAVVKVLVGNRSDNTAERVVDCGSGKDLADSLGVAFFETSCRDDLNVHEAFASCLYGLLQLHERTHPPAPLLRRASTGIRSSLGARAPSPGSVIAQMGTAPSLSLPRVLVHGHGHSPSSGLSNTAGPVPEKRSLLSSFFSRSRGRSLSFSSPAMPESISNRLGDDRLRALMERLAYERLERLAHYATSISSAKIDDRMSSPLHFALRQNTSLLSIKTLNNELSDVGVMKLCDIIVKNTSIRKLQFRSNGPISAIGYEALGKMLPLSNVRSLSIEGNPLRSLVPRLACAFAQLVHLDLTAVGLDDAAVAGLANGLQNSSSLVSLALAHNSLASLADLGFLLVGLRRSLRQVDLSGNCFQSLPLIIPSLIHCGLSHLNLQRNSLDNSALLALAMGVRMNFSLSSLGVDVTDSLACDAVSHWKVSLRQHRTLTDLPTSIGGESPLAAATRFYLRKSGAFRRSLAVPTLTALCAATILLTGAQLFEEKVQAALRQLDTTHPAIQALQYVMRQGLPAEKERTRWAAALRRAPLRFASHIGAEHCSKGATIPLTQAAFAHKLVLFGRSADEARVLRILRDRFPVASEGDLLEALDTAQGDAQRAGSLLKKGF